MSFSKQSLTIVLVVLQKIGFEVLPVAVEDYIISYSIKAKAYKAHVDQVRATLSEAEKANLAPPPGPPTDYVIYKSCFHTEVQKPDMYQKLNLLKLVPHLRKMSFFEGLVDLAWQELDYITRKQWSYAAQRVAYVHTSILGDIVQPQSLSTGAEDAQADEILLDLMSQDVLAQLVYPPSPSQTLLNPDHPSSCTSYNGAQCDLDGPSESLEGLTWNEPECFLNTQPAEPADPLYIEFPICDINEIGEFLLPVDAPFWA